MTTPDRDPLDVLIVDDAEDFRELLRLRLARNARINIVGEATNGEEALTEAAARHTDVVVLDLSMPVMDGLEAAPLIKQENPAVKIVVLSGFRAGDVAAKAAEAGADAYVEKSAVFTELESAIFAVAEGRNASDGPATTVFQHRFATELGELALPWRAAEAPAPLLLLLNHELALELGLDPQTLDTPDGLRLLTGTLIPPGATPVAQAYAGHQFGGYSPRLGDGRALLLGELTDREGRLRDLHLKGSGRTPFSRGGDGLAAVGPMLREYVMSEAMHALGVPTTRALAVVATGQQVRRETVLPGAVLARVADSHLRVGTFQYAASQATSVCCAGWPTSPSSVTTRAQQRPSTATARSSMPCSCRKLISSRVGCFSGSFTAS